jgi:hypothetical protein
VLLPDFERFIMPKFIVTASYVTYCTAEIEADSRDDAWQIALNMDGGEFETHQGDDWSVEEVREVEDIATDESRAYGPHA